MKNLKLSFPTIVALVVMIVFMALTRANSPFAALHLADFTIPALFIAGVYFKQWIVPAILIVAAVAIDNFAIVYQGVSANCITPAYSFLPLTYLFVFWIATKLKTLAFSNVNQFIKLALTIVVVSFVQWALATTSYYFFTAAKWADFGAYAMQWAPVEIVPVLAWMAVVSVVFTINNQLSLISYFKTSKR